MKSRWISATSFVIVIILCVTQVRAGETLPLEQGTYVEEDGRCDSEMTANKVFFNGKNFGWPHAAKCEFTKVEHKGKVYNIMEKCIGDGGMGGSDEITNHHSITIKSKTSFLMSTFNNNVKKLVKTYRYCGKD